MPPLPDFTNTALFPPLNSIPIPDVSDAPLETNPDGTITIAAEPLILRASDPNPRHYLLAEVKHHMTITKPTLVLADRAGTQFAMTFNGNVDFAAKGLRKGSTAVVPNARLIPPKQEGGHSSVQVFADEVAFVRGLPGGLGRVLEVGERMRSMETGEGKEDTCAACGERKQGGGLKKCTGCGMVRYCSKECQVKDWNEGNHKGGCKIMKGIGSIWPES